jgi:hypothetical protein
MTFSGKDNGMTHVKTLEFLVRDVSSRMAILLSKRLPYTAPNDGGL